MAFRKKKKREAEYKAQLEASSQKVIDMEDEAVGRKRKMSNLELKLTKAEKEVDKIVHPVLYNAYAQVKK